MYLFSDNNKDPRRTSRDIFLMSLLLTFFIVGFEQAFPVQDNYFWPFPVNKSIYRFSYTEPKTRKSTLETEKQRHWLIRSKSIHWIHFAVYNKFHMSIVNPAAQ